jgi:glycosyltransferase involved in cell wall biosynthesis
MLIKTIDKKDNNVIHAHWIIPQGFIAVIYKRLINNKVKIIVTSHGGDIFSFDNFFGNIIKKFVLKHTDEVTAVSNAIKNKIHTIGYKKEISVFPMGIDTNKFNPNKFNQSIKKQLNIENYFLLFVGRIVEKKGLVFLIKAMPQILQSFPKVKLVVIGDGPEKDSLFKLCNKLNILENVIFLGAIPHNKLPSYYATADIFIGPSVIAKSGDREGFGLVFAEAMSSETVVIATNLPAIQDIVNKNTGFIVEQKNPHAIATTVVNILKNKSRLEKMKKNGRMHIVSNYDISIVNNNYKKLIEKVFSKKE